MERYEIEAFLTLAGELHFGRTADRLNVSAGHISKTIKKVERRIGVPLFERTSRRVALTPIGAQLRDELQPAYDQVQRGIRNAIAAGRGVTGVLRIGFFGADAGQFLHTVGDTFRLRYPGCEVLIKEMQLIDGYTPLRTDEVEMMLLRFPTEQPDLAAGPVLFTEQKVLAVSSRHPFARRASLSLEDLGRVKVLRNPASIPDHWDQVHSPQYTPSGRPIESGPSAETFLELLSLVAAGKGVYPEGASAVRFYTRPDVAYIPFHDAPPLEWGLVWRAAGQTSRIRAFVQTASLIATDRRL
ncbi:LysR family transcriptional regulator [Actinomadura sp. 9N407]|uniref:LysR family transcriptional regulator n=1 Tax=Actinomadura sp. 9N407 TaxID=3375154 RepID=UPI00379951EF